MAALIKSVRLTDELRNTLTTELMKDKFVKEFDELYKKSATLADSIYKALFSNKEREKFEALPVGWLPEADAVTAQFAGEKSERHKLHFNGYSRFLPWKHFDKNQQLSEEKRRFPQVTLYGNPQITFQKSDTASTIFFGIVNEAERLKKEHEKLKNEITGVFCSVTTTGKLCTIWPEVEPFVRKHAPRDYPNSQLPAKVLVGLNERLGLKKIA